MHGETTAKRLEELVSAARDVVVNVHGDSNSRIEGMSYDSRRVERGDLFFCIPGTVEDGHEFAAAAVARGATALCVQRRTGLDVAEVVVTDPRRAMALIGAEFYGRPADDLLLIGVTGTNGKTTTAFLLESILAADGRTTGLIGTIETRVAGERRKGVRTTPESLDLQALFAEMLSRGVDSVAMEVTSHALVLHRVESVRFEAAAFTNLSQDHLDFHAGMEDYFAAKRSLFVPERLRKGAVNVDDPYGRELLAAADVPCTGFGLSRDAEVRAEEVTLGPSGNRFVLVTGGRHVPRADVKVSTSLVGTFNVSNCLAASAAALLAGVPVDAVQVGLARLDAVPGRFEAVDRGQPFSVVVDYAHTPDSLDNVLREARRLATSNEGTRGGSRDARVIAVFGCGGDRDRGKRPLMGAVAARRAHVVVVTSDNPRSEDPKAIIEQILEGVVAERPDGPDAVIVDRREAIARALELARPGDVVVIAGKGHETYQELADATIPFDDREIAAEVLVALGWGSRG